MWYPRILYNTCTCTRPVYQALSWNAIAILLFIYFFVFFVEDFPYAWQLLGGGKSGTLTVRQLGRVLRGFGKNPSEQDVRHLKYEKGLSGVGFLMLFCNILYVPELWMIILNFNHMLRTVFFIKWIIIITHRFSCKWSGNIARALGFRLLERLYTSTWTQLSRDRHLGQVFVQYSTCTTNSNNLTN